jgi:diacylglycerol kinase
MKKFLEDRIDSFGHAIAGLKDILATEHNALVHAFFTLVVLALSWVFKIPAIKFLVIIIFICLVWITEALNTVLEIVIDIVSPQYCNSAKRAKDIAAAAVLFASMGALAAGLLIFGQAILEKIH